MDTDRYVCKSWVTGQVFGTGTREECERDVSYMNYYYQSDEYIVEPWDDEKAAEFFGR